MTLLIDGKAVRQLRNDNTLTVLTLAYAAGLSSLLLRRIEADDPEASARVTLAQLDILATTLGVAATTLLRADHTTAAPPPEGDASESTDDDVRVLVGLLAASRKPLRPTVACDALGWPLRRVQRARKEAVDGLARVGLHLHSHHDGWQITPLNATIHTPAAKARANADGLDTQHAKFLHRIYRSRDGWRPTGRLSADVQISAAYLERAGLVVHEDGAYRLSEHLRQAITPPRLANPPAQH